MRLRRGALAGAAGGEVAWLDRPGAWDFCRPGGLGI